MLTVPVDTILEWIPLFALFVAIWGVNAATARGLKTEIRAIREDLRTLETATRTDIQAIRTDMQNMESGIRTDMKAMETGIRTDMQNMDTRLTAEIRELREYTTGAANAAARRSEALSERLDATNFRIDNLVDEVRRSSVAAS
jgi:Skp family chaperone for outer membrane proteins